MAETPDKRDRTKRSETQSTVAISRPIVDKLRQLAKDKDVNLIELTDALLEQALAHGSVTVKVKELVVDWHEAKGGRRTAKK